MPRYVQFLIVFIKHICSSMLYKGVLNLSNTAVGRDNSCVAFDGHI